MQDSRSNIKVVCNFPRRFIEEEISYTLANPVNYISIDDNVALIKTIDLHFSHWSKLHDIELLKQALIFGEAYEIQYINKEGEFRAGVFTPLDVYVVEDGTIDKQTVMALHLFKKPEEGRKEYNEHLHYSEYLDVYLEDRIIHYKLGDDMGNNAGDKLGCIELEKLGEDTHIFDSVPVTICRINAESHSMIDDIKSLNDSYNSVLSDLVNEVSDFRNAFLTIVGAELEKDDVAKLKEKGIIQVPTGASVDFLIKQINDSFVQNLLTTLEKKIYQLASHIDTNEKLQPNTSSLALRSRLIGLENKCSLNQAMMEMAIKQRLKRFFEYIKVVTGRGYDYRTIKLKFTSNVPTDIQSIAQVITQLQNTISQETALSLLPFIENPKLELEKFIAEKELLEGINLDNVNVDFDTRENEVTGGDDNASTGA